MNEFILPKNEIILGKTEEHHSYKESQEVDDVLEYEAAGAYKNIPVPGESDIKNVKKMELLMKFLQKNNFELYLNSIDFLGYDFEFAIYESSSFKATRDVLEYFYDKKLKVYKVWKRRTKNHDDPEVEYKIIYIVQIDADSDFFNEEHSELEEIEYSECQENDDEQYDDYQNDNENMLTVDDTEETETCEYNNKKKGLNKTVVAAFILLISVFIFFSIFFPIVRKNKKNKSLSMFNEPELILKMPEVEKELEVPVYIPRENIEKFNLKIELKNKTLNFRNANYENKFSKILITEYCPDSDTMKSFYIYPRSSVVSISGTKQNK